jgi:hypothetical protein
MRGKNVTPIKFVKELAPYIEFLESKGITSLEELSNHIAADPNFIADNFPDDTSGLEFAELASKIDLRIAKRITRSKLRDHLADICVAFAIVVAIYGIFRDRTPAKVAVSSQIVVSKASGLDPYQIIKADDIVLTSGNVSQSAFTSMTDVVGRYVAQHIPKGTTLERSMLNDGARLSNELDQRRLIRLKLQPSVLLAGFHPPIRLDLLASPHDKGVLALFIHEIYIVDFHIETDGISAVVATSPAEFDKLAPLISTSDLYVIGPVH